MKFQKLPLYALLLGALVSAPAFSQSSSSSTSSWSTEEAPKATTPPANHDSTSVTLGLPDFTKVVEKTENSVVNIRTMENISTRGGRGGPGWSFQGDPDAEEFFNFFFGPDFFPEPFSKRFGPGPRDDHPNRDFDRGSEDPKSKKGEKQVPSGVGSGFIISKDGYIITNDHVVDKADKVIVTLNNGKEYDAEVIGSDKRTDLALIKVDAKDLEPIEIGNSDALKKGQWVLAIGSPYDLESTVTSGIVSAINRDTGDYLPFIQTDVAINPGNSGGPLIDLQGKVVGVNSQIYTRSGGSMGISFSIPINEAINVINQLKDTGVVERSRMGVTIGPIQEDVYKALGLSNNKGALVSSVEKNGPADRAGIRAGDVILKFDGKAINKWTDLPRMVGQTKPGKKTEIEIFRLGKSETLAVTVEAMESKGIKFGKNKKPEVKQDNKLGLSVVALDSKQRDRLNIKGGVQVFELTDDAKEAGFMKDDIILTVNNVDVSTVEEFNEVANSLPKDKVVAVLVLRDKMTQWITTTPSK